MLDPRLFRDAEACAAARDKLARRGQGEALDGQLRRLLELAERRRKAITEAERLKAEQNARSREVGERKKRGEDAADLLASLSSLKEHVVALEQSAVEADGEFSALLHHLPNLPADDVPAGGPEQNRLERSHGEPLPAGGWRKPHWDLGRALGLIDFERASRLSGSGFPLFTGLGARLERALINFLLDLQAREHGYVEVSPPLLVSRETMTGTGQLPKFEDDLYRTAPDDLFLIPTAEVPVTNLHRGEVLAATDLPRRYVAYTPCWRREAGAAGADTRGILRVHQFDKVELVWFSRPEDSLAAHEELVRHAEVALERLGIAWRRVLIAAGDMGFANHRQYDLEAWAPGVGRWLEVSSCSSYADFQARRMDIRFKRAAGAKPEFVHTLNGSALGLARTLIAVLETFQEEDGSIRVPEVLVPYLGVPRIGPGSG
jgi:seryl-tRNA synthetase